MKQERRKWWVLAAMGVIGGLFLLDETVVGVALPSIRHDLQMSATQTHWVISIYFLTFTVFAAISGKMGDRIGFRNVVILGGSLFGLASLGCGLAPDASFLIAARAVQGIGAAILFPSTIAMISIVFPEDQRGMAIGAFAAITTTFLAIGPLVGGLLTELLSWPWVFWVNVPLVPAIIAVILVAWTDLPREAQPPKLDYAGLIMLTAGLCLIVFTIMQGASWGWANAAIIGPMAAGTVALILFVHIENRQEIPLIEVDLFRSASFSASVLVLFIGQYCKIIVVVFGALYLQDALGMQPLMTGFALLAAVVGFPFLSGPVGRLADRHGARKPVLAGLAVATVAMGWIAYAATGHGYAFLLPGLIGWGLGMPFCYVPVLRLITNSVSLDKQGQASGIAATSRLVGGTMGVSLSSTMLVSTGSFSAVFTLTGALMLVTLLFGWWAIERPSQGVNNDQRQKP